MAESRKGRIDLVTTMFLALVRFVEALIRSTRDGKRTFFDPKDFAWMEELEASTPLIERELDSVLSRLDLVPNFQDLQVEQSNLTADDRWKTFFFCGYGSEHRANLARCPETARLLAHIPGLKTAFFSILAPKKRLPRHRGPYKGVLRYHLALKVPEDSAKCGLRVAHDLMRWRKGRSVVFDDTHLHEAWNDTDETRVVLFVDFVRPLPWPISVLNKLVLRLIEKTSFVQQAVRRVHRWEEMFGPQIDRSMKTVR